MSEKKIIKVAAEDIKLQPVIDPQKWAGSRIAEIFDTSGKTNLGCGIHEIPTAMEVTGCPPTDEVIYVLEGQIDIRTDDRTETLRTGDCVYLSANTARTYIIKDYARLLYVTHPANWKNQK